MVKNWKTWAPLAAAISFGLIAAVVARGFLAGRGEKSSGEAKGSAVAVVTVKEDVMPGEEIKEEELEMGKLASDGGTVPAQAFSRISDVAGRVSQVRLIKGQAVLETLLAPKGSGTGLQALIPPGMRAITIDVNESNGVAGLLVPGCHVDVLATIGSAANQPVTRTVIQDLRVTAVGQKTSKNPGEEKELSRTVTLIASPRQAEELDLLAATGHPRLVLRSGRDNTPVDTDVTTLADVRGEPRRDDDVRGSVFDTSEGGGKSEISALAAGMGARAVAKGETKLAGRTVTIIRGGVESTVVVPDVAPDAGIVITGTNAEQKELAR